MGSITNPSSVRLELSRKFDALPIFKRDRATTLYHLCAALEMSTNPYTVDPDLVMAMGRRALEASMRAIPAIYRNCSAASAASQIQFNPASSATPKAASFKWGYPPARNVRAALKIAGATASMSFSRRSCSGTRSPSSGFTPVSHACTTAGESCSLRVRAS
jgi:hypothetical protein